MKIALFT